MSIKVTSVKCPQCGASVNIEDGNEEAYCSYCGSKVFINNENEYVHHNIDEAAVKQAETDRIVRLKQMEIAEKERESNARMRAYKIRIAMILGLVGVILMIIGFSIAPLEDLALVGLLLISLDSLWGVPSLMHDNDEYDDNENKVRVPNIITNYEKKSYQTLENIFRSAGFTNIQCVPLNDLTTGLIKKPGMVESITINGIEVTSGGKKYSPEVAVVISYHSFEDR